MSQPSTDISAVHSPSQSSDTSGGFKSFWRKSDRDSSGRDVQFVAQDPSTKRGRRGLSRLFGSSSSAIVTPDNAVAKDSTANRRQQVYQAQKRHRNRKSEYVQSLEAEVAVRKLLRRCFFSILTEPQRLQHQDALVNSERNMIALQNEKMKALLTQTSVEAQLDVLGIDGPDFSDESLSLFGSAAIDIRYDPLLDHERVFMDLDDYTDSSWSSTDASVSTKTNDMEHQLHFPQTVQVSTADESWAALDFILALEWPCSNHVRHEGINPNAVVPPACDVGQFHGHAFTTTQAVYQSSFSAIHTVKQRQDSGLFDTGDQNHHCAQDQQWQLPHSEIDKLVHLSSQLELDDEQVTPAMAYATIKRELPEGTALKSVLDAMKVPLSKVVKCSGFGAWMPIETFQQCFQQVCSIDLGIIA
ncbi:hypothetical protein LTR62_000972 [Meristemomyces frigidus]|uniref:BZIP domain-containing protein n=1 Tax=Meristemomyces frigidus TaxID=1508187 RepID=A0AAN7T9T4_9PEZI|nr:hypothetical protein LTR62_000972 [Meristemomyces frigidus]